MPDSALVEAVEEGIVFGLGDAPGVERLGEDAGQRGFADAEGSFNGDEAGRSEEVRHRG
jgi:hypothetical protein